MANEPTFVSASFSDTSTMRTIRGIVAIDNKGGIWMGSMDPDGPEGVCHITWQQVTHEFSTA